jgi:phospholipid-binding lipoprotein MlaA
MNIKILLLTIAVLFSGCATNIGGIDPYEKVNRKIYIFNKKVDKYSTKPIAKTYTKLTPKFVQTGIKNFISNLDNIPTAANNLLQGNFNKSLEDMASFSLNLLLGLGGLYNISSDLGLEKNDEDFGQTLGVWGFKSGPYIMLPFLGPSSMRDLSGKFVDINTSGKNLLSQKTDRNNLRFIGLIDKRSQYLDFEKFLKMQFDEYAFIRKSYLNKRKQKIGIDTIQVDYISDSEILEIE